MEASGKRNGRGSEGTSSSRDSEEGWSPPVEGTLKVNIDSGWSGVGRQGGAMVIRDHRGECMYVATVFSSSRIEATLTEARTLSWTMLQLMDLGLDSVVIETYAQLVLSCFGQQKVHELLEPVVQDCRELASHFNSFGLMHVKRAKNKVAHLLASLASKFTNVC